MKVKAGQLVGPGCASSKSSGAAFCLGGGVTLKAAFRCDSPKAFLLYFRLRWLWMLTQRCFSDRTGFVDVHVGDRRECRDKHAATELCK